MRTVLAGQPLEGTLHAPVVPGAGVEVVGAGGDGGGSGGHGGYLLAWGRGRRLRPPLAVLRGIR